MAYRKSKQSEPQSILKNRAAASPDKLAPDHAEALAGLMAAAIRNQNACYFQPGRYGSITFKVYIEGDQFAENLILDDSLGQLCEEIVEALYTQDDVGWNRRAFGLRRAERPSETPKGKHPGIG